MTNFKTHTILNSILYILLSCIYTSCIYETLEECEDEKCKVSLQFVYTHHFSQDDLFVEQVNHLTLFFYNESNQLTLKKEISREEMIDQNTVQLEIPPNKYTIVVWGNIHGKNYQCQNIENLQDMILEFTSVQNGIITETHPEELFHSMITLDVQNNKENFEVVPMIKNSNRILVLITGIQLANLSIIPTNLRTNIQGQNRSYKHDNSLASHEEIIYTPKYYYSTDSVIADFQILRIFNNNDNLFFSINEILPKEDGRIEEVIVTPLIPLIVRSRDETLPEYFERQDSYAFHLSMDIDAKIEIKEWEDAYNFINF